MLCLLQLSPHFTQAFPLSLKSGIRETYVKNVVCCLFLPITNAALVFIISLSNAFLWDSDRYFQHHLHKDRWDVSSMAL